ncbi:hypothetical protein [Actinomadura monticuli]|uniref:SMI1/KNR4 family protein n=1 Tax=Actinomadura monticuli TaxID=3097367 RepID=A0ABV4Q741_9ACTN
MSRKRDRAAPDALDPRRFTIAEYRRQVLARRRVLPGELAGCSPGEIDTLMYTQQVGRVPWLYREFLGAMGKNPHPLMGTVEWSYPDLRQAKDEVIGDLRSDGVDTSFLDDALVIGLGSGHFIFYIPGASTAPDDPPVWTTSDGSDRKQIHATFREFLLSILDGDGHPVEIK